MFKLMFLAFISYPDAIAKLKLFPQLFSVIFFFMLFLLGIGSLVAMASVFTTLLSDRFPVVKHWQSVLGFAVFGIVSGSFYLTPVSYQISLMQFTILITLKTFQRVDNLF